MVTAGRWAKRLSFIQRDRMPDSDTSVLQSCKTSIRQATWREPEFSLAPRPSIPRVGSFAMMALMNSMSMSESQNRTVFHATQSVFYQSFGSVFEVTHLVFYFWHSGQIAIYIGKYKMHIL